MKKLITAVTLMLVFSINANAQNKKTTTKEVKEVTEKLDPAVAAKNDAIELSAYLGLKENESMNFQRLFEMKYQTLQVKDLSDERRTEMRRIMDAKIRASLDEKQMEKLEKNVELFKKLIN